MEMTFQEKSKPTLMADILNATGFHLMKIIRFDLNNRLIFEDMTLDRLTVIGQTAYKKINLPFALEAFIPLFTGSTNVAGVVYMAKQSGEASLPRGEAYLNGMRQLLYILERELNEGALQDKLNKTVLMLLEIANKKEPMMMSGAYQMMHWSVRIARQMQLAEGDIHKLQLAALMESLGKIYQDGESPPESGDTPDGMEDARRLVTNSHRLALRLGRIFELSDIPEIILRIFERPDGTGEPDGLSGEGIPFLSRVLAVADAVSRMFAAKPVARTLEEIVEFVKSGAGSQFDARVADAALTLLIEKQTGDADLFSGMGSYATLSVTLEKQAELTIQLYGQVRKIQTLHVFYPLEKMPSIDPGAVSECALYLDVNERIIRFDAHVQQILPDRILLSRVEPTQTDDVYSVLWYMDGTLITSDKKIYDVYISILGGDYMDFYILNDQNPPTAASGIVKAALKEGAEVFLPGIVTFRQTMRDRTFFRFQYTNMTEASRQAVFSAMFKKQLEMRASIARATKPRQSGAQTVTNESPGS
jgi:hypothetical protein